MARRSCPAFVAADPYGAGVAAVLANVNDLAAMGARPVAMLDTVVGTEPVGREILRGMRWAAELYDVPIVGGHLTRTDGPPALSAFGIGRADRVLSARHAAPGQELVLGCCIEGAMRSDFPFFPSFDERGARAGRRRAAARRSWPTAGTAVAAKDVSMAGLVGSLAMLLEPGRLGVSSSTWTCCPSPTASRSPTGWRCFPCYAFLLTARRTGSSDVSERFRRSRPDGRVARRAGRHRPRCGCAVATRWWTSSTCAGRA